MNFFHERERCYFILLLQSFYFLISLRFNVDEKFGRRKDENYEYLCNVIRICFFGQKKFFLVKSFGKMFLDT